MMAVADIKAANFQLSVAKNLLGWMMMALHLRIGDVSWDKYKDDLVSNTDFKKFDRTLRQNYRPA